MNSIGNYTTNKLKFPMENGETGQIGMKDKVYLYAVSNENFLKTKGMGKEIRDKLHFHSLTPPEYSI